MEDREVSRSREFSGKFTKRASYRAANRLSKPPLGHSSLCFLYLPKFERDRRLPRRMADDSSETSSSVEEADAEAQETPNSGRYEATLLAFGLTARLCSVCCSYGVINLFILVD